MTNLLIKIHVAAHKALLAAPELSGSWTSQVESQQEGTLGTPTTLTGPVGDKPGAISAAIASLIRSMDQSHLLNMC